MSNLFIFNRKIQQIKVKFPYFFTWILIYTNNNTLSEKKCMFSTALKNFMSVIFGISQLAFNKWHSNIITLYRDRNTKSLSTLLLKNYTIALKPEILTLRYPLLKKCSNSELFWSIFFRIQSEFGKRRSR